MSRNDAAAPGHVCPGIRIHAIDIVQPPGIGISPIADMEAHQTVVSAVLTAKSSAEKPKNDCSDARSEAKSVFPSPRIASSPRGVKAASAAEPLDWKPNYFFLFR